MKKIFPFFLLFLVSCTTMATIQKMQPMRTWYSQRAYDEIGFCFIDDFEASDSISASMTAIDVRNRTHTKILSIQGAAKADSNFGIFEVMSLRESAGTTRVELRGLDDPSTTAMIESIERCLAKSP